MNASILTGHIGILTRTMTTSLTPTPLYLFCNENWEHILLTILKLIFLCNCCIKLHCSIAHVGTCRGLIIPFHSYFMTIPFNGLPLCWLSSVDLNAILMGFFVALAFPYTKCNIVQIKQCYIKHLRI